MQDLSPLEIKFRLYKAGFSQADIARKVGVTSPMASRVVLGRDRCLRVENAISEILGFTPWPEANHRGPIKNGRSNIN